MLLRVPKNETQFTWCDHTEIENVDLQWRVLCFLTPAGDRLYESGGCVLEPGDSVLDIGANVGLWSVMAIRRGASRVLAYEPNVANFECARENINYNARLYGLHCDAFHVFPEAIADQIGQMEFYDGPTISQHGLYDTRPDHRDDFPCRLVQTWSLDDVFHRNGIKALDFLKCDGNGAEYLIFRGAADSTLKRVRKIGMQYHHWVADLCPDFLHQFELRLHGLGFETLIDRENEYGDCYLHAWQPAKRGRK